jgi:hypothetical protein
MYDLDGAEKEDTDGLDELFDTCEGTYETLEDIPQDLDSRCASFYILTVLSSQLSLAVEAYKEVSEGYDKKVCLFSLFDFPLKSGCSSAL